MAFFFKLSCKYIKIGKFHLNCVFFFLEKIETSGNIKPTFSTDGASVLCFISSRVDGFSPFYNFSDPNKHSHRHPGYTERAFS